MPKVIHLIDATIPAENLRQMAVLARLGIAEGEAETNKTETIVSIGSPPEEFQISDFKLQITKNLHCPFGLSSLGGRQLKKFIQKNNADILHCWSVNTLKAARAADTGLGIVLTLSHLPAKFKISNLKPACQSLGAGRSQILTVPTEQCRRAMIESGLPEDTVHVLPPAAGLPAEIWLEAISNLNTCRSDTRRKLGMDDEDFLLIAPGEMTLYSGHHYAAWAMAIIEKIFPRIRLAYCDFGPKSRHVKFFAENTGCGEKIFFTAGQANRLNILSAADAAVFFHTRDCGVQSLAESMAVGLPIVASDLPDIRELFGQAVLVPPNNPRLAAAGILKLIEDNSLAFALAAQARDIAERCFNPKLCRKRLEEIYKQLKT